MRREAVVLADIIEAANRVAEYLGDMPRDAFLTDRKTQAAVLHEIVIMGEAAGHLPQEFRNAHVEAPWSDMIQLRNYYIHAYHRVDFRRVWRAATIQCPRISRALAPLLEEEQDQAE